MEEFDSVTGDYDFDARRFDATNNQFIQPDSVIQNVYDPQSLNHYAFERNNPYSYTDPTGRAAVWIHYIDTLEDYLDAGFSLDESLEVAAGAAEPDLYRYEEYRFIQGIATILNLDLELDYEGDEAERYYHFGQDLEHNSLDLESDYWNAIEEGNFERVGNIEHALGHDVGSGGVQGYHSYEIENSYEKSSDHDINDILSTRTDRTALKQQQFNRAQEARNTRTTQACFIRTTSFGGQSNA